jgi:DNA-binding transcriptional ArsR family regulator
VRNFERALKAVGDPTRTRILKLLEHGPLCVCQVQSVLRLAPSTVSKHLSILKAAGLVEDQREGRWIRYRVSEGRDNPYAPRVLALLRGPLGSEPRIVADRERLAQVCVIPLEKLCGAAAAGAVSPVRPRPRAARKGASPGQKGPHR